MKLFEPLSIREMELRNRIVMAPMGTQVGFGGSRGIAYWTERAKGGAGAIMTYGLLVDMLISDEAWGRPNGADRFCERLGRLAQAVRESGAKLGIQLWHINRLPLGPTIMPGSESVGPSPGPRKPDYIDSATEVRGLTIGEIEFIIDKFAKASARARAAGIDFVEFHGAHAYLACQFFSPHYNRRTDRYGGDLTGRMRFGIECVKAMRGAVGEDYPLLYRLGATEEEPGGITLEESCQFAVELEKAGADVISVSTASGLKKAEAEPADVSTVSPANPVSPTADRPMGTYVYLAEAVKRSVRVPVMAVGRINRPEIAEAILSEGKADLIAIGRQLIADPFWPDKAAKGDIEDIRPCLSCNTCVHTGVAAGGLVGTGTRCTVNAWACREDEEHEIQPAGKPRKVLVVGGGPAGMEAARAAALRGHHVTLVERGGRLGGQLIPASVPPYKDVFGQFREYLIRQLDKAGVSVKVGEKVTREFVERSEPDVLVLATGANPLTPDMPGIEGDNVAGALDVLSGRAQVGKRVVVVGGGMVGCETAEWLVSKGKEVTIVEMLDEIAQDIDETRRPHVIWRLRNAGVRMHVRAKVEEISSSGVRVTRDGSSGVLGADTVVIAVGMQPDRSLAEDLQGWPGETYLVGDCVDPRQIVDAIADGARVASQI